MTQSSRLTVAILAGLLLLLSRAPRAEVICSERPPLKPVHCICGKLVDPAGGPVSGALVKVSQEGAEVARGSADANGRFQFTDLKSGQYELVAESGTTFVPFRLSITLAKPKKKCRHPLAIRMVFVYPDNCGSYVIKQ